MFVVVPCLLMIIQPRLWQLTVVILMIFIQHLFQQSHCGGHLFNDNNNKVALLVTLVQLDFCLLPFVSRALAF